MVDRVSEQFQIIDFPLRGMWRVLRSPGHHRYAFDFAAVDSEQGRMLAKGTLAYVFSNVPANSFFSWARPVYAPFSGQVRQAVDGWPDRKELNLARDALRMVVSRPRLDPAHLQPYLGNFILIESPGAYALLAHLRMNRLQVAEGESVQAGQVLAEVGNSGFTLAPHLHFQMMANQEPDPDPLLAPIIPFRVRSFERWNGQAWEIQADAPLSKGDLVRSFSAGSETSSLTGG